MQTRKLAKISTKELEQKYLVEKLSVPQMAKIYKVGYGTMWKELNFHGISLRSKSESLKGRIFSKKHRQKISKSKSGPNHPNWGKKYKRPGRYWYQCPDGEYVSMRSGWEVAYAEWLDGKGIKWKYEPKTFILSEGNAYTPDFLLEDGTYVEVKGWLTAKHKQRIEDFKQLNSHLKFILADGNYLKLIGCNLSKPAQQARPKFKCKQCGKFFYRKEKKQFLCSTQCRNKYVALHKGNDKEKIKNKLKRKYDGSQVGENNNGSKLNEEKVKRIFELRNTGKTLMEISLAVGASIGNIGNILHGRSWKHIYKKYNEQKRKN